MKIFERFETLEGDIYKICPDCRHDILPEWKSCYELEWCPFCGCNHEYLEELGKLPN